MRLALLLATVALSAPTALAQNWQWLYDGARGCKPCVSSDFRYVYLENSEKGKDARAYVEERKQHLIASKTEEEVRHNEGMLRFAERDLIDDDAYLDIDGRAKKMLRDAPPTMDKLFDELKENIFARLTVDSYDGGGVEYSALIPVEGIGDVHIMFEESRTSRRARYIIRGVKNDQHVDIILEDDGLMRILSNAYVGTGRTAEEARADLGGKMMANRRAMTFESTELLQKIYAAIDTRYNARREKEQARINALVLAEKALESLAQVYPESLLLDNALTTVKQKIPELQSYSEDPLGLHR
jgi:hypothetical protein